MYGEKTFVVQTNGQLMKALAYAPMIIAYRNGNPVRLDEVARVFDGIEDDKQAGWFKGERAIMLPIMKQPGTNVVAVVDAVKGLLPTLREQLPASVSLDTRFDRSKEFAVTIGSMTVSLTAVFIPVLFMGGIVGRLLHEFAVTISVAILVSGFVSISLTPMLASRFLRPPHAQRHGFVYNAIETIFQSWLRLYDVTLRASLRFHVVTMAVSIALLVGTWYLFQQVPKGFLPSEDQGRFSISTEALQGISLDEMTRHQLEVAEVVAKDPSIAQYQIQVGGGGGG